MNLDKRQRLDRRDCVAQGIAVMRPRAGVDNDSGIFALCLVNFIKYNALVIALDKLRFKSERFCVFFYPLANGCESFGSVDPRLTHAYHIEVRTVNNQNLFHYMHHLLYETVSSSFGSGLERIQPTTASAILLKVHSQVFGDILRTALIISSSAGQPPDIMSASSSFMAR